MNKIEQALTLALEAHQGQIRKGSDTPYIMHPIEVGLMLSHAGLSDEAVCAGFLHDILEDTDMDIERIRESLGQHVTELIDFMTEPGHDTRPWDQRKRHTIELASRTEDAEKLLLLLADKLANIRSVQRDRRRIGSRIWDCFSAGRDRQAWYYKSLGEALLPKIGDHPLYREYSEIVSDLFGE